MEDQARGQWVLWGTSAHTDVNSLIMQSLGSALSGALTRLQEQDPQWTPPGEIGADGRTSWMEVVREMTEREVETAVARRAARGSIRLG